MVHVIVIGRVQGVGFRQFVKSNALKLNIRGWVRNLSDRSVEAMFAGEQKNVEILVEKCNRGPFLAEVKEIKTENVEDQDFKSFEIIT